MNIILLSQNYSKSEDIEEHLFHCDTRFSPPLSTRVAIREYATKLASRSDRFEAWESNRLISLIAVYLQNCEGESAFISNVSVCHEYEGCGLASRLLRKCIDFVSNTAIRGINLRVSTDSAKTILFYKKHGFSENGHSRDGFTEMNLILKK